MPKNGNTLFSFLLLLTIFSWNCGDHKIIPPVVKPKVLNNINFYLDTSASMKGYMNGNTEFVRLIPNLLVDIEGKMNFKNKNININYISDVVTKFNGTTRDFINHISTTNVATAKSSQINKVFESVINATDSNDISLLVSDCILSFPNKDIRANPEINVQQADGALKAFVKQAFLHIRDSNMCAMVYGFNSNFFGTYYAYNNSKIPLTGNVPRPYYIWAIGNKELLQKFNAQFLETAGFKPALAISFGMFGKPIDSYTLLFKMGKEPPGAWDDKNNSLANVVASKKKPARFSIAVDFSSLPDYVKDSEYLRKSLKILHPGLDGKLLSVRNAHDIDISKAETDEKRTLDKATHVISFEVADLYESKTTLTLQLPLKYDTVYKSWSVMDDRNINSIASKTFAFEHLVDAVREAYEIMQGRQGGNENFVNISINLTK